MKLSKAQKAFLIVLLDGKARSSRETAQACGRKYFGCDTSEKLRKHDCIQPTNHRRVGDHRHRPHCRGDGDLAVTYEDT